MNKREKLTNHIKEIESHVEFTKGRLRKNEEERDNLEISDFFTEEDYRNYLDSEFDPVEFLGVSVAPSEFIETHDEPAFSEGYNNWLDGKDIEETDKYKEISERIENLENEISGWEDTLDVLRDELNDLEEGDES